MPSDVLKRLRTSPFERTVLALLGLAFLFLAVVGGASVLMLRQSRDFDAQVLLTQQVRELAQDVLTDTVDAETGQRGYVLTGQPPYLDVYNAALRRLSAEMRQLRDLSAPHPDQVRRIDTLKIHVDAKVAELKRGIAYVDAHRQAEAVEVIKSGKGLQEMVRVRELIGAFNAEEVQRLNERIRAADNSSRQTLTINLTSAVLIVVLGLCSVLIVQRYIDELRHSRTELDRLNQGLERTVEERTAELVNARDRAEALLREVNHRVGNSLQLVSSFISLQARAVPEESARLALKETQARIEAVAHIHRRLYTSDDVTHVELKEYLGGLIEELQGSMAAGEAAPRIVLDAEPLRLPTDRAVSLGVVVAELVTNAFKYAYPPGTGGEIRVSLKSDGEGRALLTVEDDGPGLGKGKPKGTGLGKMIISSMATNLKSKVDYDTAYRGVRASLRFES